LLASLSAHPDPIILETEQARTQISQNDRISLAQERILTILSGRVRVGLAIRRRIAITVMLCVPVAGCGSGSSSGSSSSSPPPSLPVINSFAASPASVAQGQSTILAWQVTGATSLGISNISGTLPASSSSVVVVPATSTTYTLTATNSAGSAQQNATVTVTTTSTPIATVQMNPTATTVPIAANFLSIGMQIGDTTSMVGTSSSNVNPILEQLLKNLTQYANAPLLIRDSNDTSEDANDYSQGDLGAIAQVGQDLGAQFMVGVVLGNGDLPTATSEAQQLAAALPGGELQAIELGNEPDLYYGVTPPTCESATWDYSDYLSLYQQFAPAVMSASGVKLEAPVWAGLCSTWMDNLESFISTEASTIAVATVHHYSGTACNGATEPANYLLTEPAVDGDTQPLTGPVGIPPYLPAAQTAGIPFRIGELNSINCGGQLGVSNSFSSALWGMDIAFSYANVGVSGVNFFSPGDPNQANAYTPFDFTFTEGNGGNTYSVRNINPLYYGLLLFAEAVQNKAQLLPVTFATPTQANIKSWATIDGTQTIRLLLLNKDQNASGAVSIALSGYGSATVVRLMAPSYSSTSGVTLGGQTFDGSTDGTPQGTAYAETAQPASGVYTIAMPTVSGALITIQP
jgi:hypothetical protein